MSSKVALVTGASSGIGWAIAEVLAEHGHDLLLVARSAPRLEERAEAIAEQHGIRCDWVAADLASEDGANAVLDAVTRRSYVVDLLVNNAGALHEGDFLDVPLERHESLVSLNVLGVMRLTHPLARQMRDRNTGRILNIASTSAFNPVPSLASYAASKAFLLSFSEALGMELSGTAVTVTASCPGFTNTGMIEQEGRKPMQLPVIPNLEPRAVAEHSYAACMRGEPVTVPGLLNRLSSATLRRVPGWLRRRAITMIKDRGI